MEMGMEMETTAELGTVWNVITLVYLAERAAIHCSSIYLIVAFVSAGLVGLFFFFSFFRVFQPRLARL